MKKALLSLILLAAAAVPAARGGIILSDDFTYNDGPIAQPTAAIINPSSTWIANTGSGLGKDLDVTNNVLIVTSSRSEDGAKVLAGQPYLTNGPVTALYSRFTLKCTRLPSSTGSYVACFVGTNVFGLSGLRCRVFASATNLVNWTGPDASLGQWNLGISSSGNGSSTAIIASTNYCWPTPLVTNVNYTIVTRYVLATGLSTLWVNPTNESDASVTDPTPLPVDVDPGAMPSNGIVNISLYEMRQAASEGTHEIDNLRVGTHFADVAGNNQAPAISSIPNQSIPANGNTGPIPFTVQDPETPANELVVTVTSSNTILVPNGSPNIVTNGSVGGTNRTVTITPAAGQQGSTTITVTVSDTVNSSFTTFDVSVGTPTLGPIANVVTPLNTPTASIPFTVADAEGNPLTITKSSSNPGLVPVGNIQVGVAVPNVSSNVVVTPQTGVSGVSTITIFATDGFTTNSTSFKVTVTPAPLGVVYNEDFAYTSFDTPNALYLASGGSGAPWLHVSGPLYQLQVTNYGSSGLAYLVSTNDEDLGAGFIGDATYNGTNGYVFYTSFTVDFSFLPSVNGDYFFHLKPSPSDSSTFHDKVFANRANAATNRFRLGVSNTANSPSQQQYGRDLMLGATYAVVTRFNAATGDSTLWVNPVNEQSPNVTSGDSPGASTVGAVALRQTSGIGDLTVGPMKVGSSFSDVWTAPTQPVLSSTVDNSGNIVLSWTNPLFMLQSASVVTGPYTDVAPTSPYTNSISGQQYFRLHY